MAQETEIKLRVSDVEAFQSGLKRIGARLAAVGRVHEWNVIFDTPRNDLAKRGQLLRIRVETPRNGPKRPKRERKRVVLTFKRPMEQGTEPMVPMHADGGYKVREEIELEVADAENLTKIFEGLGMKGWFRYEKYRTTYQLPGSKKWAKGLWIELDETSIGTFVELEGPPQAIDRAAKELGFSKHEYIAMNYLSLYLEHCRAQGIEPRDMMFPEDGNR
jgi:adenylate cyclase class 2